MNARHKIMIVEDDMLLCDAFVELLQGNGYQALPPMHTYEDAKKQLLQCEPDLALVDIGLPGEKDGIQLASYIYRYTQIPVVFITGYTDAITLQRAKKSHPSSIVLKTKPIFSKKNLIEAIAQQLLASILIASPDEALHMKIKPKGLLLKVTEKKTEPPKITRAKYISDTGKANKKTLIPFDDIQYIATNNKETRNTILIKPAGDKAFIYRDTLASIEKELPDYFVKVKDSHIINMKKVTHCIDERVLFIDSDRYDVSENHHAMVYEKKRIYLSHLL
jgi:DNA-binding LytR/AlgR family response regulator